MDKLLTELERNGTDYVSLHRLMAAYFAAHRCGADSDWLADLTLDELARQVDRGTEIRNLFAYTRGTAAHVYSKYIKKQIKLTGAVRELAYLFGAGAWCPEMSPDLLLKYLTRCLKNLPEEKRRFMLDYYSGKDRRELAAEYGITVRKLYSRADQIRRALRKSVEDCRKSN